MTRREMIASAAALAAAPAPAAGIPREVVARHDANVERLIKAQAADGTVPDQFGLRTSYTQVGGALAPQAGTRVYLCGFTPFDHEIEIT